MSRYLGVTAAGIARALGFTPSSGGTFPVTSSGVVSSGGSLQILSGGSETISSGATLNVASGGSETILSGGTLTVSGGFVLDNAVALTVSSAALGSSGGALQALHSSLKDGYMTPGLTTGRWHGPPYVCVNSGTTTSAVSGTIYATLFYNPVPQTISNLGSYVLTSATGHLMWGVYAANPVAGGSGGTPAGATLVGATTSVSISATSAGHSAAFSQTLDQGYHWICVMADAAPTMGGITQANSAGDIYALGAVTMAAPSTQILGFTAAGTVFSTGFPSTFPAATLVSAGTGMVGTMVQK